MLESLFNSEYCEIFKSIYCEEHLLLLKYSQGVLTGFSTSISETSENVCFYFMIGFFLMKFEFTYNISIV